MDRENKVIKKRKIPDFDKLIIICNVIISNVNEIKSFYRLQFSLTLTPIVVYTGGYYHCSNAQSGQYCLNGRCIVDYRYANHMLGANVCPTPFSQPKHNQLLITDTETSTDPKNKVM